MDSLYASRRTQKGPQDLIKLENLSPDKYGKAAFVDLTYTPSKLADNYLYKEVTTLKKMEEGNNKLREYEAFNSVFQDRLNQLREQRDGIQQSLNSQIKMYKKLLAECEAKNQIRIREIQNSFKEQMRILLQEKEEEAKFAQSEKQLLESRIEQLQAQLANLHNRLNDHSSQIDNLKSQKEKLDIQHHNLLKKMQATEAKLQEDAEKAKKSYDELREKFQDAQIQWKKSFDDEVNRKNKEIQNLERLHRNQLEKIENKRAAEALMKNQEIKDLTNSFDAESKRLNEIINMKEKMVQNLNSELSKQKQVVLQLTRSYEKEINDLIHDKERLLSQVDDLSHENTRLHNKMGDQREYFAKEKADLEQYIITLKNEIEMNQVNYVRQRDRSAFVAGDLERENSSLRAENCSLKSLVSQNQILAREVRNLRELLLESSNQMQKCKDEFIRMGKERDMLLLRLKEAGCQNQVLHRIKIDREEEARGWKQSYYMSKRY